MHYGHAFRGEYLVATPKDCRKLDLRYEAWGEDRKLHVHRVRELVVEDKIVFPPKRRYDLVNKTLEGGLTDDTHLGGYGSDGGDGDGRIDDDDEGYTAESATFAGAEAPGPLVGSLSDLLDRTEREARDGVPGGAMLGGLAGRPLDDDPDDLGRGGPCKRYFSTKRKRKARFKNEAKKKPTAEKTKENTRKRKKSTEKHRKTKGNKSKTRDSKQKQVKTNEQQKKNPRGVGGGGGFR